MKKLFTLIVILLLACVGYFIYRGVTSNEVNAKHISTDISNLSDSVTKTFKAGVNDVANDVKVKANEAKIAVAEKAEKAVDSATNTVKSRIGDIKQNAKNKFTKTKDTVVKEVKDKVN